MISRRPKTSLPHSPKIANPTRCVSNPATTAGLMPLSAAQLCIHISATGSTKSPRSRRSYNVSQEAVRQALYILLQRPRSAGRRATDEFGAHSLEELVGVYAREYSDWENLKARQIMAELNLRFAGTIISPPAE